MQVYIVVEQGKAIERTTDCFRNFVDIEESIKISWSKAETLRIVKNPTAEGPVEFLVAGTWPLEGIDPDLRGKQFVVTLQAWRFPVWDSPTHL